MKWSALKWCHPWRAGYSMRTKKVCIVFRAQKSLITARREGCICGCAWAGKNPFSVYRVLVEYIHFQFVDRCGNWNFISCRARCGCWLLQNAEFAWQEARSSIKSCSPSHQSALCSDDSIKEAEARAASCRQHFSAAHQVKIMLYCSYNIIIFVSQGSSYDRQTEINQKERTLQKTSPAALKLWEKGNRRLHVCCKQATYFTLHCASGLGLRVCWPQIKLVSCMVVIIISSGSCLYYCYIAMSLS